MKITITLEEEVVGSALETFSVKLSGLTLLGLGELLVEPDAITTCNKENTHRNLNSRGEER